MHFGCHRCDTTEFRVYMVWEQAREKIEVNLTWQVHRGELDSLVKKDFQDRGTIKGTMKQFEHSWDMFMNLMVF